MKAVSLSEHAPGLGNSRTSIQVATIILCAILLTLIQDFLHSHYKQYPFYLSESLLFKSFWILFFPFIMAQLSLIKHYRQHLSERSNLSNILSLTFLPTILHLLLFPLTLLVLSALFLNHTYGFLSSLEYTIREDLYKYLFIYGLTSYFSLPKNEAVIPAPAVTTPEAPEEETYKSMITIRDGRKNIAVKVDDINFISSANPYVSIHTAEGAHLYLSSLKAIADILAPDQFVRVHKSTIVNIKKVSSYKSRLNGDYDILLLGGEVIRLSRNYSHTFKKQFN